MDGLEGKGMIQNTIKNTIKNTLQNTVNVYESLKPVTQGMTLTESWVTRGTAYSTLGDVSTASARVDAIINNTDSGVLMEAGGTGQGLVLYVYSGVLYFQCGNGSDYGANFNRAEISYTLPVGQFNYTIEWSADSSSKAVLYINGVIVGSQTFSTVSLAGANPGTVGEVSSTVAVNRAGWASSGSGFYTNTINKCDIFNNQITLDV